MESQKLFLSTACISTFYRQKFKDVINKQTPIVYRLHSYEFNNIFKLFMIISRHDLLNFDCCTDSFPLNWRGRAVPSYITSYPTDYSTSHLEIRLCSFLKAVLSSGLICPVVALTLAMAALLFPLLCSASLQLSATHLGTPATAQPHGEPGD